MTQPTWYPQPLDSLPSDLALTPEPETPWSDAWLTPDDARAWRENA